MRGSLAPGCGDLSLHHTGFHMRRAPLRARVLSLHGAMLCNRPRRRPDVAASRTREKRDASYSPMPRTNETDPSVSCVTSVRMNAPLRSARSPAVFISSGPRASRRGASRPGFPGIESSAGRIQQSFASHAGATGKGGFPTQPGRGRSERKAARRPQLRRDLRTEETAVEPPPGQGLEAIS